MGEQIDGESPPHHLGPCTQRDAEPDLQPGEDEHAQQQRIVPSDPPVAINDTNWAEDSNAMLIGSPRVCTSIEILNEPPAAPVKHDRIPIKNDSGNP